MKVAEQAAPACSAAEALLSLMVLPCPECGRGPLELHEISATPLRPRELSVRVSCQACTRPAQMSFALPGESWGMTVFLSLKELARAAEQDPEIINHTGCASRLLDAGDWLLLHGLVSETARAASETAAMPAERADARRLQILAGLCLDEALRFYDDENELPPQEALFSERSRQRFRDRPELFTRPRLRELRSALPQPRSASRR